MNNSRLAVAAIFLAALPFLHGRGQAGDLPDTKDKVTLQRVCTGCHELDEVLSARRTEMGWQQSVDDMISRGAEASDEERQAVVAYLTKYFGKLNVNTAALQQLQDILGLTEKEAQALVAYRDRTGKFKNFDELQSVPGLSPEKLQEKRDLIAFTL